MLASTITITEDSVSDTSDKETGDAILFHTHPCCDYSYKNHHPSKNTIKNEGSPLATIWLIKNQVSPTIMSGISLSINACV